MFIQIPWQALYMYIHQVIYSNKIKHKYTLTPLNLSCFIGPIQPNLTCPLGTPVKIYTATCLYYVHYVHYISLHVVLQDTYLYHTVLSSFQCALFSVGKLPTHITQLIV